MSGKESEVVVTIDFGTNNSRYVFRNPNTGSTQEFSAPTVVLFTPEGEFHSFGTEADDKFREMGVRDEKELSQWYLFEKFKMKLYGKRNLTRDMKLLDYSKKKSLPAMKVFSAGIGFLKNHALQILKEQCEYIPHRKIHWAVTVPGFWDEKAKSFMREAAEQAGLPGHRLQLVLESEAAAVSFMEQHKDTDLGKPGAQFIVQDIGAGKTDISAFEVQKGKKLRQLHRSEGSSSGGNKVNDQFKKFLVKFIGIDAISSFRDHEMRDLMNEFEKAKCAQVTPGDFAVKMPDSIVLAVDDAISRNRKCDGKVRTEGNVLILDRSLSESFVAESAKLVSDTIQKVKDHEEVKSIDTVCLVGGESENPVVQETVQRELPQSEVVVPPEPAKQTLTGAAEVAHNPEIIASRISTYTYGVAARRQFIDGMHDPKKLITNENGTRWCDGCFDVHITIGQEVEVNTRLPYQSYFPATPNQFTLSFNVYRSTKRKPMYVDEEGSEKIGTVTIPVPNTQGSREVKAAMMVGGTELTLEAIGEETQQKTIVKFDFLSKD